MPPDEPGLDPADTLGEDPSEMVAQRSGLADWLWVPLLTAAIAAGLFAIGRATFVA